MGSNTMSVTLPNGYVLDDVPEGTTQQELFDVAIRNNLITQEEIDAALILEPEAKTKEPKAEFLDDPSNWMMQNLDIPAGIAGGIAGGAAVGSFGGPVGTVVGGVLGGMAGTIGGYAASDYLDDGDVDWVKAGQEGLYSGAMDVATLGAFKFGKVGLKALGFGAGEMPNIVKKINAPIGSKVGTLESRQATQELLEEGGGSLSAYQTGNASGLRVVMESIGDLGIVSRYTSQAREAANNAVIQKQLTKLMEGTLGDVNASAGALGEMTYGLVRGATAKLNDEYGNALQAIMGMTKGAKIDTKPLAGFLRKYKADKAFIFKEVKEQVAGGTEYKVRKEASRFDLQDQTEAIIDDFRNSLSGALPISADAVRILQRQLNDAIGAAGDFGTPSYNSAALRELTEFSNEFKKALESALGTTSPDAAKALKELNKGYKTSIDALKPEITTNMIKNADKGAYESLGSIFVSGGLQTPSKIAAFMGSIDEAFKVLGDKVGTLDIPVKTAKEARQLIKQGYMKQKFGGLASDKFDITEFAKEAAKLEKDSYSAPVKLLLGENYAQYKQLMNAMSEASQTPNSLLGSLVLRSKESQALSGIVQAGAAGVTVTSSVGAAAAVFGVPYILSKVASNQKAVRKLLALDASSKRVNPEDLAAFIASNSYKVFEELSDEDKLDIRQHLRQ